MPVTGHPCGDKKREMVLDMGTQGCLQNMLSEATPGTKPSLSLGLLVWCSVL